MPEIIIAKDFEHFDLICGQIHDAMATAVYEYDDSFHVIVKFRDREVEFKSADWSVYKG